MTAIHDGNGNEIGDIALSEKQQGMLENGEEIVVIYHTPQLLLHLLGEQSGSFVLQKRGQNVVAKDADPLRRYASLQRAIKAAREQH